MILFAWCMVVSYTFTFYIRHLLTIFILCSVFLHEGSEVRTDIFKFKENSKNDNRVNNYIDM